MTEINVIDRNGTSHAVIWGDGLNLMEAIRASGVDDLVAMCGGCCSCATCHVYVEGADMAEPSEDEDDLLTSSLYKQANSRLSCQLSDIMPGIRVTIAPEE